MIVRPFTFLTGLLFAFSGAYLFVVKHRSQSLEDKMGQLAQTSRADEQAIRVLKAQWALEADPSRIAALATEFTQLQPMKPSQLVTLASLSSSLPAPGSPAPYSNPEDLMPSMPDEGNGLPQPSGPAIQVRGHNVADATQAGQQSEGVGSSHEVAANEPVVMPLPPPPAPYSSPALHASVRMAASEHVSHSWIAPIPRQAIPEHKPRHEVLPLASQSYVIQTRAEAIAVPPSQPLGAQIVRIKAVARVHHDVSSNLPFGGGSLLGMAQDGSQN